MSTEIQIADIMNSKKVCVISIEFEITDRRDGEKFSTNLYEIVKDNANFRVSEAINRIKDKADKLGCDIEPLDITEAVCVDAEIDMKALFKTGDK